MDQEVANLHTVPEEPDRIPWELLWVLAIAWVVGYL